MRQSYDVIILGAGAAGMMCAIEAGKRGRSVLVLDHAAKVGSKVLLSGGGQCNFTNLHMIPDHYISENPHFCKSVLARFTPQDFVALLEKHGIAYHEKAPGQLFCNGSAQQIARMLIKEASDARADIHLNCPVLRVEKPSKYDVLTPKQVFHSDALVVATGGLSYPRLGASDLGFRLARQFGLKIITPRPALVPLTFRPEDRHWTALSGVTLPAAVACGRRRFQGNILFTHRGLSGPPILQISSYWNPQDPITLHLAPETDLFALLNEHRSSKMELRTLLARLLPARFADLWCRRNGLTKRMNQHSEGDLLHIADGLCNWSITPAGTEGYNKAEVTRGGVDTRDLSSKTLEAQKIPGLYFIGEILDVTGQLGGYNLHWAWASGFAAGQFA